jgi:hypothetical protein
MLGRIEGDRMTEKEWLDERGGRNIEQLIALELTHRIDSIVVAIEDALMAKSEVTEAEQVVLTVEAMEREVNNGGFEQFFLNSSNQSARRKPLISRTAPVKSWGRRLVGPPNGTRRRRLRRMNQPAPS